jgi:hypothetical protein
MRLQILEVLVTDKKTEEVFILNSKVYDPHPILNEVNEALEGIATIRQALKEKVLLRLSDSDGQDLLEYLYLSVIKEKRK